MALYRKKARRRYPAQTTVDADYTNDIVLLANIPSSAESMVHSQERAGEIIELHVNADKTAYMCFNQEGNTSTLNGVQIHVPMCQCLIY